MRARLCDMDFSHTYSRVPRLEELYYDDFKHLVEYAKQGFLKNASIYKRGGYMCMSFGNKEYRMFFTDSTPVETIRYHFIQTVIDINDIINDNLDYDEEELSELTVSNMLSEIRVIRNKLGRKESELVAI